MKYNKKKILRRVSVRYEQLSQMFKLPSERGFTLGIWGDEFTFWKKDEADLIDWRCTATKKEFESKFNLLPGERIISDDYWVFTGYHIIIETNKRNMRIIQKFLDSFYYKKNWLSRIFTYRGDAKDLYFSDSINIRKNVICDIHEEDGRFDPDE